MRPDDDLDLLSALGVNADRFSVERSRVAPRRGETDRKAPDRYARIAGRLRERGIEPVVTLHHFTHPLWFADGPGWADGPSTGDFLRFAEKTVREAIAAYANILRTHAALYDMIHAHARERPAVGVAHNMVDFHPAAADSALDRRAVKVAHAFYNVGLLEAFRTGNLSLRLAPMAIRGPEYSWEDGEGIDIGGHFWWSLMDDYEWLEGLRPRFGLFRVDFDALAREATKSAAFHAEWIRRHPDPRKP